MQIRKLKLHLLVPSLVILGISLFIAANSKGPTDAQTGTGCSSYYLTVDNQTNVTTALTGLHQITVLNPNSSSIKAVNLIIDSIPMGAATTSSGSGWNMPWYTQAAANGGHAIGANVQLDTGVMCPVPGINVMTFNSTVSPIGPASLPATFNAQTNDAINFTLGNRLLPTSSLPTAVDVTANTIFQVNPPSLGTVTPQQPPNVIRFSAGTVPGNTVINIVAFYGGTSRPISVPVTIYPQTTTSTSSGFITTTSTSGSTSTSGTATTTSTSTTSPSPTPYTSAASIESDPTVKSCIIAAITEPRYNDISAGKSRPTAAEFDAMNKCFADRNNVLPTGFVPIAPDKVAKLPEADTSKLKIAGATNQVKKTSGADVTTLKFSGKAKPNTTVILYVHSEPLVLSTTADSNGDWNYSLEDPLEAGKHEVYAVVDKGDGTYQRSSPFDFVIAKASASAVNPKGYSLKLDTIKATASENKRPSVIYLSAIAGLILLFLLGLALVLHRRLHDKKPVDDQPEDPMKPDGPATPSSVITPSQPVEPPADEVVVSPTAQSPVEPTPSTTPPSDVETSPSERQDV